MYVYNGCRCRVCTITCLSDGVYITVARRDHTGSSCFVCILLTYSRDRAIYATDDLLSIDDLMAPFKGRLVGKPKFFIFQV